MSKDNELPKWPDDYDAETVAMSGGTGLPAMQWTLQQRGMCGALGDIANHTFCRLPKGHNGAHKDGSVEWE
jgi:hypothetical protein